MPQVLYQWIDLLWIPMALLVVHKGHRLIAVTFILTAMLTMRTQIELMEYTGYPFGFLNLMKSGVFERGLVIYGVFIAIFLVLAYFSKNTQKMVFFAAALTVYILALCFSMAIMAL